MEMFKYGTAAEIGSDFSKPSERKHGNSKRLTQHALL